MTWTIKAPAKFLMAIDDDQQLSSWLAQYHDIRALAFLGRSNVGKSTLINSLFGKTVARTSKTPGRTRKVNIFSFNLENRETSEEQLFYFFDLPGYGYAKVSKSESKNWNILMNTLFNYLSEQTLMINIQDARHPNQEVDREFYKFIKKFDFDIFLVLNKLDKLKTQKLRAKLTKEMKAVYQQYKAVREIYTISAEKNLQVEPLTSSIISFLLHR